ncbi:hypothetical protein [Roseibium sp.]|uniref:hypothetical protein n=1 Tax=Roseibium sp. TaxID=1936156 RepID=UPI003D0E3704
MKRLTAFLAIMVLGSGLQVETALAQSDFYIRSQYSNGGFTGSHEILTKPKDGYYKASYCQRPFWVSSSTILWTEEEAAAGRKLILEEDVGDGTARKVVCADYSAFATLDDLGLNKKEVERIRAENQPLDMQSSRLRIIRDAFKQFK